MARALRAALLLALGACVLACVSNSDCHDNGVCDVFGTCVCNPGFTGTNCGNVSACVNTFDPVTAMYSLFVFGDYTVVNGSRGRAGARGWGRGRDVGRCSAGCNDPGSRPPVSRPCAVSGLLAVGGNAVLINFSVGDSYPVAADPLPYTPPSIRNDFVVGGVLSASDTGAVLSGGNIVRPPTPLPLPHS